MGKREGQRELKSDGFHQRPFLKELGLDAIEPSHEKDY